MSARAREGFSIVELIIALVILTAGLLAMASASGFSTLSVQMAATRTSRAAAVASEIETIRSKANTLAGYQGLTSKAQAAADTLDGYTVWYEVAPAKNSTSVTLHSLGRSYVVRRGWLMVQENFAASVVKPSP